MPLTQRTNGSSAANIISASWWNEYRDLLTGTMTDQPVNISNSLSLKPTIANPTTAPSAALVTSATGLSVGLYQYMYTWVTTEGGETIPSPLASITTTASSRRVNLSNIAIGPAGIAKRNIYRSKVGGGIPFLVTTLNDNATTTYADSTPDTSLVQTAPVYNSTSALIFKDSSGNLIGKVYADPEHEGTLLLSGIDRVEFRVEDDLKKQSCGFFDENGLRLEQLQPNSPAVIVAIGGLGIKNGAGTKLCQAKNDGRFIISGNQYQTSAGSISTNANQSFDAFDVAEIYECDADYLSGVVVCPGERGLLSRCVHDNCPCALVVSSDPGFLMGEVDHGKYILPVALAGRVNIRTSEQVKARDLLVSDGHGGVRVLAKGESGFVIGFALIDSNEGMVGTVLRSMKV